MENERRGARWMPSPSPEDASAEALLREAVTHLGGAVLNLQHALDCLRKVSIFGNVPVLERCAFLIETAARDVEDNLHKE